MEIPKCFKELHAKAQPKLFLKHELTEDELVRETRKELQSDPTKSGSAGRVAAEGQLRRRN
jgi:hypothetical protein